MTASAVPALPVTPSFRLDGRRALVTGAGRGIGLAAAVALADAGAELTLASRTQAELDALAEAIRARGGRADTLVLDVTDSAAVTRAFADARPFEILVNNAGTNRPKPMTETSPMGSLFFEKPELRGRLSDDEWFARKAMAGVPGPLVEVRIMGDEGACAWNGRDVGELQVRGPFITGSYHGEAPGADKFTADGWLRTGDVAAIDANGYIRIADRTKDLIKSGGEWISSVDLENAIMAHPAVAEAAVIAIAHPKWTERPLACVVTKPGATVSAGELREFLAPKFARWQLPDAFEFIEAVPRTSTGKFWKARLRERFTGWHWPDAPAASEPEAKT